MATMRVKVVSPERVLFSGESTMVVTRTLGGGEIAFQPGHAPFLAALTENHTRIYLADGGRQDVAVHGGFVEVSNNTVSLGDVSELRATSTSSGPAGQGCRRAEPSVGDAPRVGTPALPRPPRAPVPTV